MKPLPILVLLFCLLLSCEKQGEEKYDAMIASLNGVWVGVSNPTDTINFDQLANPEWFILNRGYEYQGGNQVQRIPTSAYSFRISGNSISLQNLLLSCICRESFYFSMNKTGEEFTIGDFIYHQAGTQARLTFRKIE